MKNFKEILQNLAKNLQNNYIPYIKRFFLSPVFISYLVVGFFSLSMGRISSSITMYAISDNTKYKKVDKVNPAQERVVENQYDPSTIVEENGKIFTVAAVVDQEESKPVERALQETVPFQLLGTLDGHYTYARALIEVFDPKIGKKEFAVGQRIKAARIRWIGREYIIYTENGERKKLKVGEKSSEKDQEREAEKLKKQQEQEAKKKQAETKNQQGKYIKKVLSREEVLRVVKGNVAEIYQNAAFGPWVQNGKIEGYRISRVSRQHIFYKLGARSGDIIKTVNGHNLSDLDRLINIWKNLPSASNIKLSVLRKGELFTYEFFIQD